MAWRFELVYAPSALEHLVSIERVHHSLIRAAIEGQLAYEPNVRTCNRKLLIRPCRFGEAWELRYGPDSRFRIFYRVEEETSRGRILAIATKSRGKLNLGGKDLVP